MARTGFSAELFKDEKLQLRHILQSFGNYRRGRKYTLPKTLLLKIFTNTKSHQFKGALVLSAEEGNLFHYNITQHPQIFLLTGFFHDILMCSCMAVNCLSLAGIAGGGATDIWYQGQFLEQGRLFFPPEDLHYFQEQVGSAGWKGSQFCWFGTAHEDNFHVLSAPQG